MLERSALLNPLVKQWLAGIEPVWTLLDNASYLSLYLPPSRPDGPIKLAADLSHAEIQQSDMARNALILLRAAATGPGLKLTATGNLSREVVAGMIDQCAWEGYDKADAFRYSKVINEPDVLPLFFLRHLAETARLVRRQKGYLKTTQAGRRMLQESDQGALQAILFEIAFWRLDLSELGRGLVRGWPQCDVGPVLWSLSMVAGDWQPVERLSRLCTVPTNAMLASPWDIASFALESTILRALQWFGMFECQGNELAISRLEGRPIYRKSNLFDRFLMFNVKLSSGSQSRH